MIMMVRSRLSLLVLLSQAVSIIIPQRRVGVNGFAIGTVRSHLNGLVIDSSFVVLKAQQQQQQQQQQQGEEEGTASATASKAATRSLSSILDEILNDELYGDNDDDDGGDVFFNEGQADTIDNHDDNDNDNIDTEIDPYIPVASQQEQRSSWKKKSYYMLRKIAKLVREGHPTAATQAEATVQQISSTFQKDTHDSQPLINAYNLWINAIAKTRTPHSGTDAEQVLNLMEQQQQVMPNIITYTSVIDAYSKTPPQSNGAKHAERILFHLLHRKITMVDPSIQVSDITCNAVINAWAQQGTYAAAHRANLILQRILQLQNDIIKPTTYTYGCVMNAFAKIGAVDEVQKLLEQMNTNANDKNNNSVKPDTIIYNIAINAWATSGDARAGMKANALLEQMREAASNDPSSSSTLQPDLITYNSVISAWSKSGHINAAQQSERVLQQMVRLSSSQGGEGPKPNTVSYNTALHAWARSSLPEAPDRATKILTYMIKSGDKTIEPDIYSYTSVLNVWAKSKRPHKAKQAKEILDGLVMLWKKNNNNNNNNKLTLTIIPFNTVLNACAFSAHTTQEEQKEAMAVAVSTFTLIRSFGGTVVADTLSYGNLLKCCHNLMSPSKKRTELAMKIFDQCAKNGLVGELVWQEINKSVPKSVLRQYLSPELQRMAEKSKNKRYKNKNNVAVVVGLHQLPQEWRHNVGSGQNREEAKRRKVQKKKKQKPKKQQKRPAIPRGTGIIEPSYTSGKDI